MDRIGEDVTRNWNYSRPSWKPTSMSAQNTPAAAASRGSLRLRFRSGRFQAVSPGPGLVSEVLVSKFGDHLPLYRLEDIIALRRRLHCTQHTL